MLKTKFAIIALAIFTLFGVSGQIVSGAEPQNQLIVVLLDRHAIVESQNNKDLTESFLGLLSMLRDGEQIILMTADDGVIRGPEIAGSAEYKLIHRNTLTKLANSSGAPEADMVDALATNFEILDIEQAAPGSTVYVVTGGESEEPLGETSERLSSVLQRFEAKDWSVVGVTLPGSSPYASELFSLISSETGEQTYPLSVPDGFKAFTDHILSADAKGQLAQLGQGDLAPNEILSSTLDIAPASIETTMIFFKERPTGSLRLKNPSGFEASKGDRALSQVIETPFIVMWKLVEPVPGQWSVDMHGVEGKISAWHYSANKLGLGFLTPSAIPLGQTVPLVAYITDGSERVTMTDVEVRARVTGPNGSTITYSLNDNGEFGDSIAGDGFYSTSITPLDAQGDYNVDLELFWPQFKTFITSQKTFTTQPFPSISMEVMETGILGIGERTKVATAEVHVDGQPFAIPIEQLTASLTTNVEGSGNIDVIPQKLINQGRAWAFDIYYTATGQDQHTILIWLNMDYAGREYQFATDTLVLSSLIPFVPPEPFVQITQSPPPPPPPSPPPAPLLGPTMARELLAIPAVLVLALIAFGVYIISRTRPYGYLYNDRGELLVNFKTMPRKFAPTFMFRDKVEGNELGVGELGGVSFSFSREKVDIRSSRTDPSVRINNRPLVEGEEAILHNETWIGTQGKLFSFLLAPLVQPQPGTGDD